MATKKQKREAALEKRQRFLDEEAKIGMEALQKDRERRAALAKRAEEDRRRERQKTSSHKAVRKLVKTS